MNGSTVLLAFKEKIEDAAAMVCSMDAEEKLQAVEYWNVVSEQLQIIVNHSAEDISAFAFQLDRDNLPDFIDASQLVALGLAPTFLPNFMNSNPHDVTADLLRKSTTKDADSSAVGIRTAFSEALTLPAINNTSNSAAVIQTEPSATGRLESCQPLPSEGTLNTIASEGALITELVETDIRNAVVGLEKEVVPQAGAVKDVPNSVEETSGNNISQDICHETNAQPIAPTDTTSKTGSSSTVHPAKIRGKAKDTSGNENGDVNRYYECSYCQRIFFTPSQLTTHTWTHTRPYACTTCHARFSTKGNLVVHNRRHSGERPFVCTLCQACFSTKCNLVRHRKAHSGEKPWQCSVCSSRFTEKKSLKVHMRRHTGERPYHCTMCPKSFTQPGILQTHVATHLDQRAFPCILCGKSFRQKSQLRLHEQRHAGLRKYQCAVCPSKFLTKGDMERHKRVHTGERPFVCKLCQKTFTRQQSLNEHMNRHYGLKPYQCKYCEKGYVEMSACYKHIKTHERGNNSRHLEKDQSDPPLTATEDPDDVSLPFHKDSEILSASDSISLNTIIHEVPKSSGLSSDTDENLDFSGVGVLGSGSPFHQDQF